MKEFLKNFYKYRSLVFDCDGVLLDSNKIKSDAFYELALFAGKEKANELLTYHLKNGGVSRYEKIKFFYTEILKKKITEETLSIKANLYGRKVFNKLKEAKSAYGLNELRKLNQIADWYVVSGGDQKELIKLFDCNGLNQHFDKYIFGSPRSKEEIISNGFKKNLFKKPQLFIGDSEYDMMVAEKFGMDFVFLSQWSEWKPNKNRKLLKFKSIKELIEKLEISKKV